MARASMSMTCRTGVPASGWIRRTWPGWSGEPKLGTTPLSHLTPAVRRERGRPPGARTGGLPPRGGCPAWPAGRRSGGPPRRSPEAPPAAPPRRTPVTARCPRGSPATGGGDGDPTTGPRTPPPTGAERTRRASATASPAPAPCGDAQAPVPQRLEGPQDPVPVEPLGPRNVAPLEVGRVEGEGPAGAEDLADLPQDPELVGDEVDGVAEDDHVHRRHEAAQVLRLSVDEPHDLGGDPLPRALQLGQGCVHGVDHAAPRAAHREDQLGHRPRAASEVNEARPEPRHLLNQLAVHLQEHAVPGEPRETEAVDLDLILHPLPPPAPGAPSTVPHTADEGNGTLASRPAQPRGRIRPHIRETLRGGRGAGASLTSRAGGG